MKSLSKYMLGISLFVVACDNPSILEQSDNLVISVLRKDIKVGLYPNRIVTNGKYVYVVNSGDNTVGRLDLESYIYDNNFVRLGLNYNPYSMSLKDNHLYIATSGKVNESYKEDDVIIDVDLYLCTKKEILSSLFMVSDLISQDCIEFVESEYDFAYSKANGKFTQFCPDEKIEVSTTCKNPTRLVDSKKGYIVSCSGIYQYDSDYNISRTEGSGLCFYTYNLEEISCILNDRDTGSPSVGDSTILVGSTYSGIITILKDSTQDTVLIEEGNMLVPLHIKNDLYAIAGFNNSTIYLYDAVSENVLGKYEMSKTELDKKGPIDLLYIEDSSKLIVLNTLSETIDILEISMDSLY